MDQRHHHQPKAAVCPLLHSGPEQDAENVTPKPPATPDSFSVPWPVFTLCYPPAFELRLRQEGPWAVLRHSHGPWPPDLAHCLGESWGQQSEGSWLFKSFTGAELRLDKWGQDEEWDISQLFFLFICIAT